MSFYETGSRVGRVRAPACAAILVLLATLPAPAAAQPAHPDWKTDVAVAGLNALAGALSAGVTALLRGDDVTPAFLAGAAGGGAVFVAKRVSIERFDGAGLLGRQIGAVGSSVVANGGAGRGWLEEVWLPVGPLWVQVSPRSPLRADLDLWNVAVLAWAIARDDLELDRGESLSSGVAVFRSPLHRIRYRDEPVAGFVSGGVMVLGPLLADPGSTRAHESVHVVQQDFMIRVVSHPLESWGWSRILGRDLPLQLGVVPILVAPPFLDDLKEAEADAFRAR